MKNPIIVILIIIIVAGLVGLGIWIGTTISKETTTNTANVSQTNINSTSTIGSNINNGFCGRSTNEACSKDSDCEVSGCNREVCHLIDGQESSMSLCEPKECHNSETYKVECGCVENNCQWRNQ